MVNGQKVGGSVVVIVLLVAVVVVVGVWLVKCKRDVREKMMTTLQSVVECMLLYCILYPVSYILRNTSPIPNK